MYDDLLQSQEPSFLERFLFSSLLPSLLVTSFLHRDSFWAVKHVPRVQSAVVVDCSGLGLPHGFGAELHLTDYLMSNRP